MKKRVGIGLPQVREVYSGPEGDLWELIMGEQIHIGGFASSMALADKAGIGRGMSGVDLCCCNGAGMRFLVRFRGVAAMHGVDATAKVVDRCRRRCVAEKLDDRIRVTEADVCATGLPAAAADFVWGEDAWCYVADKPALIAEAVRLTRPGGVIAFTDWVEGPAGMSAAEADRLMSFMTFPAMLSIGEYAGLLADGGCAVATAEDTGQFAPHCDLYLRMLATQLAYDAMRITGFDPGLLAGMTGEMAFMRDLARAGKIAQGRFVARRRVRPLRPGDRRR
jgi:SAM-dependent methyltransferase